MRLGPLGWTLFLFATSARVAPAQEPARAPLARYFPSKDLVAYVEFDGIDAHSAAWKKTAVSRIFEETPTGTMLSAVVTQILEAALVPGDQGTPTPEELTIIAKGLVRSGFAFGINRKPDDPAAKPSCVGLVLRGAGQGPVIAIMKRVLAGLGLSELPLATLERRENRTLTVLGPKEGPCLAWWVEKDDLVFSILDAGYADSMMAVLDGKEPSAVNHPARMELIKAEDDFETAGLAFLDATALPEMPADAAIFGLDGIKRADIRWGYQGEALVSVSRILAPSPRRGVLALFDQPTFDAKSLPPLPAGVGTFTAISVDLVKVFDQLAALAKAADPKGPDLFALAADAFQKETGRRLREDFLGRVGPKLVFADVPVQIVMSANSFGGFAQSLARVPRLSLLIEIRDRASFLRDLDTVIAWANNQFPIPKDPKADKDRPAPPLIRRLKNVANGYEVALSPTYWPLPAGYRPTIVVDEHYVAIGTSPEVTRQALRSGGDLGAPLNRAMASLPPNLTAVCIVDTQNSALPEVLANVPSMIQWWGFMLQGPEAFSMTNAVLNSVATSPFGVRTVRTIDVPINRTGEFATAPPDSPLAVPSVPPTAPTEPAAVVNPSIAVTPAFPPLATAPPSAVRAQAAMPTAIQTFPPIPPAPAAASPATAPLLATPPVAANPALVMPAPTAPATVATPLPAPRAPTGPPEVQPAPRAPVVLASPSSPPLAIRPVGEAAAVSNVSPAPAIDPSVTPAGPEAVLQEVATPLMQFRLRLDPDEIPSPAEIRSHLFPAAYSLSADASGFRITTREAFPDFNPISIAPIAVAVALPIYQEWHEAREHERLSANLRQIGMGLLQYENSHGHLPAASTVDKDGKPLLSWRVEILPSLGLQSLYNEFHRDEPWDSPHNKTLIERMPPIFAHPDGTDKPGMTPYRGLIGKSGFFDPEVKEGIAISAITDGTSNTLALVEAKEAVPWTKPATELPVAGSGAPTARTVALLPQLGGGRKKGGFQALLIDGSVRFLRDTIDANVLQSLITRDGGEVISSDAF